MSKANPPNQSLANTHNMHLMFIRYLGNNENIYIGNPSHDMSITLLGVTHEWFI